MGNRITGAWPLIVTWIAVLGAVIMISARYAFEADHFYGIAESREIVVNSEIPVEIKRMNVVEGQYVEKNQLLVELSSPELDLKINGISHQLDQLQAQKGLDKAELTAKIRQLQAEKQSKTTEIENQIRQLENRYRINKELAGELKSVDTAELSSNPSMSPIRQQIDNLRHELADALRPLNIRIELMEAALNTSDSPMKIQAERLEKELAMLRRENDNLNIFSRISGLIGSIHFKPGEKVEPFSPILTLHTQTPSFVKGYLLEDVYSRVKIGDDIMVSSLSEGKNSVPGSVVGVGARIVPYPVRLKKHPDLQIWGREVHVRISEKNPFILGEKVLLSSVRLKPDWTRQLLAWISPNRFGGDHLSSNRVSVPVRKHTPGTADEAIDAGFDTSGLSGGNNGL